MRQSSLKKHQEKCTVNPLADVDKDIFVCDTCNRYFSSKTDLENHIGKVHEKVFQCSNVRPLSRKNLQYQTNATLFSHM